MVLVRTTAYVKNMAPVEGDNFSPVMSLSGYVAFWAL